MTPEERTKFVKKARKALDMTQHRFAHTLGVDPRTCRRWEAGDREVPHSVILLARMMIEVPGALELATRLSQERLEAMGLFDRDEDNGDGTASEA